MFKSISKLSLATVALASLPLTACFDDNYDLSDIDTNAEIKVNDLLVPVNLDAITLSNIFDLDEGSVIKEIDGEYAVLVDGDFHSEKINISAVTLGRPTINPIQTTVSLLNGFGGIDIPSVNIGEQALVYEVKTASTSFNYSSQSVDKSIRSLSKVSVDWQLTLDLQIQNNGNIFNSVQLTDVTLQLPQGLQVKAGEGYTVTANGVKLNNRTLQKGNMNFSVTIAVEAIDVAKMGNNFKFVTNQDAPGSLEISGEIGIDGGHVVAITSSQISQIPSSTGFTIAPKGTEIKVTSVDGSLLYTISDFNVDPVTLNDLPDLLRQEETNVTIANPQLYLSINNPMAANHLEATSGLTLTSVRDNGNSRAPYSLNPGQLITIGYDKGIAGPYNFVLSPSATNGIAGFENPTHVGYTGLSNVLGGKGLPDQIEVAFDNPKVEGDVKGFAIPQNLESVEGKYSFFAPLNLGVNSQILYDGDETGWNDDTVEKIVVERLSIEATVTNSLPFDIELSGYPVDANGNQCVDQSTRQPVRLSATTVAANSTSPLKIELVGTVQGIDGIHYFAKGIVKDGSVTLRPDATIQLTGIKARVTGHYTDEL